MVFGQAANITLNFIMKDFKPQIFITSQHKERDDILRRQFCIILNSKKTLISLIWFQAVQEFLFFFVFYIPLNSRWCWYLTLAHLAIQMVDFWSAFLHVLLWYQNLKANVVIKLFVTFRLPFGTDFLHCSLSSFVV